MERQIEEDIVCPLIRNGLMPGHDNFLALTIEHGITLAPITDPHQPVIGNLRKGEPPNIKAMNHGSKTLFEGKRSRDIDSLSCHRDGVGIEDYHDSSDRKYR